MHMIVVIKGNYRAIESSSGGCFHLFAHQYIGGKRRQTIERWREIRVF